MIKNFNIYLKKYANLILKKGINFKKNNKILLNIDVEQQNFAHILTKEAYKLGALEVVLKWSDDIITKEFIKNTNIKNLEYIPKYKKNELNEYIKQEINYIKIISSNPNLLKNINIKKIQKFQITNNKLINNLKIAIQSNKLKWTIAAAAGKEWANLLFPNIKNIKTKIYKLWDYIFKINKIYEINPIKTWNIHIENLNKKASFLNKKQFIYLHFISKKTNLKINLPENHIWESASSKFKNNDFFIANIPTEEVFTTPHRMKINGYVFSTKPLNYLGNLIYNMTLKIKNGKIIDFNATKGIEILKKLLNTDKGSKYLGEVALVPQNSKISKTNIIFLNTLFDENASCHLAIGSSYPFNIKNGINYNNIKLKKMGLNISKIHVDFMIGSNDMNIFGFNKNNKKTQIFKNGNWIL